MRVGGTTFRHQVAILISVYLLASDVRQRQDQFTLPMREVLDTGDNTGHELAATQYVPSLVKGCARSTFNSAPGIDRVTLTYA